MNWLKKITIAAFILLFTLTSNAQKVKKIFAEAAQQTTLLYNESVTGRTNRFVFPRSERNDSLRLVISDDWTSGFWPGILWFIYEYTNDNAWKAKAEEFTALMDKEPGNRGSHDIGFKVYNSYGNGFRLTQREDYKKQILVAAASLSKRFNPIIGCIKSWDFGKWQYPVIIDNMMNLELLFAATRISGDSSYYKIAVAHANTTMKNHFRANNSTWHVIDYDTLTGAVRSRTTHQGYADESSWARGQAWALYGYTMCYRETKNPLYLQQAEKVAGFLLNHPSLPADKVPYWDLDLPSTQNEPKDASAAAIIASALYELKNYSTNKTWYLNTANMIIKNLTNHYRAAAKSHHGFILIHSTGNKPGLSEMDVPLIYADYYYLEALLRKQKD